MFYFLLKSYGGPTKASYQHACIVFAEGLQKLNIPYSANIDYYPDLSGNYLFKYSNIPDDTTYIVTLHPEEFKDMFLSLNNYKLIIFDAKYALIRSQSTSLLQYAYRYFMTTSKVVTDRIKPLCFAASNRMVETIMGQTQIPWLTRDPKIFWAHRIDDHHLRTMVKASYKKHNKNIHIFLDNFEEPDGSALHYWNYTGRRHSPKYYQELQKYKYMDAHGGYMNRDGSIVQWDSWKIWEGFLSGMVVITADLDYYNIKLPFKLIPWIHYIPVRYTHIEDAYTKLERLSEEKKTEIAAAGQKIVLEYFTPESMAKYIISCLD